MCTRANTHTHPLSSTETHTHLHTLSHASPLLPKWTHTFWACFIFAISSDIIKPPSLCHNNTSKYLQHVSVLWCWREVAAVRRDMTYSCMHTAEALHKQQWEILPQHQRWQKSSQLFECQRYPVQHCSVLHVNPLSAGATPFSTHSKLSPSTMGLSEAKMSERSHMSSKAAKCARRFEISLSYFCASVKRFIFVLQIWTGMCLRGNHIPPRHSYPTFKAAQATLACFSGRGREKSSVNTFFTCWFFLFVCFNWWILWSPCAWVLFVF